MFAKILSLWSAAASTPNTNHHHLRGVAVTVILSVAAAFAPGVAHALQISEHQIYGYYPGYQHHVSFQGFNALVPTGGTLNSVSITLSDFFHGPVYVQTLFHPLEFKTVASGTLALYDTISLFSPNITNVLSIPSHSSQTLPFKMLYDPFSENASGWDEALWYASKVGYGGDVVSALTNDLTPFLAPWSGSLHDNMVFTLTNTGSSTASIESTPLYAWAGVTVTYDYTPTPITTLSPVPEPDTLWLMGAGLLGLSKRKGQGKNNV